MSNMKDLKNIGKTVAHRLEEIGVFTKKDLESLGPASAYKRIQANYPDTNLPLCYYLYSLEGALKNQNWRSFSERQKENMRRQAGVKK